MTSTMPDPAREILPDTLTQGYRAFWNGRLKAEQDRYRHLALHGQRPTVLLIGCCDSRMSPEVIFNAGPGEIFVVRNIANLVPAFDADTSASETAAAIEYAVVALDVAHVVVMGHAQCGGIRAFALGRSDEFEPLTDANFVAKWKALIAPAAERLGPPVGDFEHYCESLSYASIIQGLANLRTYPWVRKREDAGQLTLHGAYFGVATGRMTALDPERGVFVPVLPTT